MSTERLSRLQKRILTAIADSPTARIQRPEIYQQFFGLTNAWGGHYAHTPYDDPKQSRRARSAWPVLCVSIRRLKERALIECGYFYEKNPIWYAGQFNDEMTEHTGLHGERLGYFWKPRHGGPDLRLTDAGKEQALNLNLVSNGTDINNKRRATTKRK